MADLFNGFSNTSNDYVYPILSPCPNMADDQYLVWTTNGLSIIKGSDEISSILFNDLAIPVNTFNKQQINLAAGEVSYIPGLTKGLCNRKQVFSLPSLVSSNIALNPYFFEIDLSVNYYKNFSFKYNNIDVSGNYDQNSSVIDALNISFAQAGIKIVASYDPSSLSFTGSQVGYDFEISNVNLNIIDTSSYSNSPFGNGTNAPSYNLTNDASLEIPFAKYQNTAMQGIILRGLYPLATTSQINEADKWFYLNHVSDYVTIYEPIELIYYSDVSTAISITFDPSIFINPSIIVNDISTFVQKDTSLNFVNETIDGSIISYADITNCIITDASIDNSNLLDVSIYNSYINIANIEGLYIQDTRVNFCDIIDCSIIDTSINNSYVNHGALNANIQDSSIINSYVNGTFLSSYGSNISFIDSSIVDSSLNNSVINDLTVLSNSVIKNTWTNTYKQFVAFDSSTNQNIYEYSTDILTGGIVKINLSTIWDSSLNRSIIYDSSIYNTYIQDSSIYGCTMYNCSFDQKSTFDSNTKDIMVNANISTLVDIGQDTSTYYLKRRKKLELGMNGASTVSMMSAGDYLNMVTEDGLWKKVGEVYMWTSTKDPDDCVTKNLIDGFYVFNPHDFNIKIEYLVFV